MPILDTFNEIWAQISAHLIDLDTFLVNIVRMFRHSDSFKSAMVNITLHRSNLSHSSSDESIPTHFNFTTILHNHHKEYRWWQIKQDLNQAELNEIFLVQQYPEPVAESMYQ